MTDSSKEICESIEDNQKNILNELRQIFQKYQLDLMVTTVQRVHPNESDSLHTHQSTWLITPDKPTGSLLTTGDLIRIYQHTSNICLEHATSLLEGCLKDLDDPEYDEERTQLSAVRQSLMAAIDSNSAATESLLLILKAATRSLTRKVQMTREEMEEELAQMDDDGVELEERSRISLDAEDDELLQKVQAIIRREGKKGIN